MFLDFFFLMRRCGLKVGVAEWMTLIDALSRGMGQQSLHGFYVLCRLICVKRESQYDLYDQIFSHHFKGSAAPASVTDEVLQWLQNSPLPPRARGELEKLTGLSLDELRKMFEERLAEQKERHDGGSHWVGTGGASPFGHSGVHPSGIRVGGPGGGRRAMQIAEERRFRNLRSDVKLDTRQFAAALRRLRQWSQDGRGEELDLEETVRATARNAGDIDIVMRKNRKNKLKLLLLMDVGGSMTWHAEQSEKLFSAAHAEHVFREFRHYTFHNCPYEHLYTDIEQHEVVPTAEVLQSCESDWCCLIVGDAAMHPAELLAVGGNISYFQHNERPGLEWLADIQKQIPRTAWLNPEPPAHWDIASTRLVRQLFPMFPLTVEGIERAVTELRRKA